MLYIYISSFDMLCEIYIPAISMRCYCLWAAQTYWYHSKIGCLLKRQHLRKYGRVNHFYDLVDWCWLRCTRWSPNNSDPDCIEQLRRISNPRSLWYWSFRSMDWQIILRKKWSLKRRLIEKYKKKLRYFFLTRKFWIFCLGSWDHWVWPQLYQFLSKIYGLCYNIFHSFPYGIYVSKIKAKI